MSLKQHIVIVNEYTIKTNDGGGSRGATPGDYVLRYMSRKGATEDLTPVQFDSEAYIERYMSRADATETCNSVDELKKEMSDIQGMGGVAFGYGEYSLSHTKLKKASKDIQDNFDKGKTVLKTVISFDEEYLRTHHIIDNQFHCEREGDYRGNIDQMKLRMAIMDGLKKMSRHYDDLQYVGVIQVDTKHVHCHLAMVDRGVGNLAPDGTQRGKIPEKAKIDLRRGIDMYLDEKQKVRHMSSNITQDKRNALCFIKKYTHKAMDDRGFAQFLISCLPDDKRLWRASTNRQEMKKPNAIVREYVQQLLDQPNSGYREALTSISEYARIRQKKEGLSQKKVRQLYEKGREKLIEDCMNGVYAILKQIPDDEKKVFTPMLDTMSMNYEDMASQAATDPMVEFGFKLRSYSSRLQYHRKEMHKYHDAVKDFKQQENIDENARPLLAFFEEEEEYNKQLMVKYQYFLDFLPPDGEFREDFDNLMAEQVKVQNMKKLRNDPSPKKMSKENAEDYGLRVYDVSGGSFLTFAPTLFDQKIEYAEAQCHEHEEEFRLKLLDYGLELDSHGVRKGKPYEFDDVKALDIHHLTYDFNYDFDISRRNAENFIAYADKRYECFEKAKAYLKGSGQEDAISQLSEVDILAMKKMADKLREKPTLESTRPSTVSQQKSSMTIRLDADYSKEIKAMLRNTIDMTMRDVRVSEDSRAFGDDG